MHYIFARYLLLTVMLCFPIHIHAQTLDVVETVSITLSPQYPKPGEQVVARLYAPLEKVALDDIVWLLDDTVVQTGGSVVFNFTAPPLGESIRVGMVARTGNGLEVSDVAIVRPAEVVLAWEGATYAPPWYRGGTYYTAGASVRAEALASIPRPNGGLYGRDEVVYTWSRNGVVLGEHSGTGAYALTTEGPRFLGEDILVVEAQSPDGLVIAEAAVRITTRDPHAVLYGVDPLIGVVYHRAIRDGVLIDAAPGSSIVTAPYFMSATSARDPELFYAWTVNGVSVEPENDNASVLNIRVDDQGTMRARVGVQVTHAAKLLQTAAGVWNVAFGSSGRSFFFGL